MAVPDSYIFEKTSNNNVLVYAMLDNDVIETFSLNPGKDLSQNQAQPDQVLIPVKKYYAQGNNTFISIPFGKINLEDSTPSGTNPTSVQEAIELLEADFFFELAGGGGGTPSLAQVTAVGFVTGTPIFSNGNNIGVATAMVPKVIMVPSLDDMVSQGGLIVHAGDGSGNTIYSDKFIQVSYPDGKLTIKEPAVVTGIYEIEYPEASGTVALVIPPSAAIPDANISNIESVLNAILSVMRERNIILT